ncbi:hypothetical protein RFI_23048 [Reticulomyxa filosa]|uniref:PNPLA domain-containing protein n=1 Tax=Reticulomyxa filosa TaxID=46433 RepID=X6MML6_RETFI|nr:hypothetical protein RFI_23048 [Reticulomyxa filosa]|eukprot:ETO14325.1 hypothetical protein RFI_23048 [Reticulomyxa filosa]
MYQCVYVYVQWAWLKKRYDSSDPVSLMQKSSRYVFHSNIRNHDRGVSTQEADASSQALQSSLQRPYLPLQELMEFVRSRIMRNYCGINNAELYSVTRIGTKKLITDFNDHIIQALEAIANTEDPDITVSEKIVFFQETRHGSFFFFFQFVFCHILSFLLGRSALLLSGGAGLGKYATTSFRDANHKFVTICVCATGVFHFGVVLALARKNLMPKIICGSSAGAIIASIVATKPTDEMIAFITDPNKQHLNYLRKESHKTWLEAWAVHLRRLWRTGNLLDVMVLREAVRANIGDLTFLEAYEKTGRILNITVTGADANSMPRLLNYLTAPNVVIWSAVVASCAIPLVFGPQELYVKQTTSDSFGNESSMIHRVFLQDGSIAHDLPMNRLQQLFNVDNFIVSQVNPHLVPFLFHSIKAPIPLFDRLFRFLGNEFHLYISSLLVNLRELGILRGFQTLDMLISQRYTGDVTIVPDVKSSDYFKLLSNPSPNDVLQCIDLSQRAVWKMMSRIEGLCAIEICLDDCLQKLRAEALLLQSRINEQLIYSSMNNLADLTSPHDVGVIHEDAQDESNTNVEQKNIRPKSNMVNFTLYLNMFLFFVSS